MPNDAANFGTSVGACLSALPLDHLFKTPANAFSQVQTQFSRDYYDWIMAVGLEEVDGKKKVVMVEAHTDEPVLDEKGELLRVVPRTISIPLLSLLQHPNCNLKMGSVEFSCTIQSTMSEESETQVEGSGSLTIGWGPFKVKVQAKISNHSKQSRSTDFRARYDVKMEVGHSEQPPEGMMKFLEIMENMIQPIVAGKTEAPTDGKKPKAGGK